MSEVPKLTKETAGYIADLFFATAKVYFGGHYTISRFTTNCRVRFGTIEFSDFNDFDCHAEPEKVFGLSADSEIEAMYRCLQEFYLKKGKINHG